MARDRIIPSDFWTREAVIDCAMMTRLLLIGLWNFADDFGVQPLKPRTIRLQVFPGDPIDNEAVRAMIDELAAQGLVRIYEVDGVEYVAVSEWEQFQRVGKNARRRFPAEKARDTSEADGGPFDHSNPLQDPSPAPVIPSEARDPSASPGSLASLGMTAEAGGPDSPAATLPASPSGLAPPSTPADAPAPHR